MKKQVSLLSGIMAFMVLVAFTPINDTYYTVDGKASTVKWVGSKITGSSHEGTVMVSEGGLQIQEGKIVNGKFTIDMTSINVTDLDGGMKGKLEGHLKNEDFFDVEKHKNAFLAITGMDGENAKGSLTIKGITQEISFPVKMGMANNQLTATAKIQVDRTKFDVRYGSDSFFDNLGDKAINNIIEFEVNLVANAK